MVGSRNMVSSSPSRPSSQTMNNKNKNNNDDDDRSGGTDLPTVHIFLSRPSYPLGGTVVGTILIMKQPPSKQQHQSTTTTTKGQSLSKITTDARSVRDQLEAVTVYVAGFCKIDKRWHNPNDYIKIYGKVHPLLQQLMILDDESDNNSNNKYDPDLFIQGGNIHDDNNNNNNNNNNNDDTVCFWATDGLNVLTLPERQYGRWKDWYRPDDDDDDDDSIEDDDDNDDDSNSDDDSDSDNSDEDDDDSNDECNDDDNDDDVDKDAKGDTTTNKNIHNNNNNLLAFTFRADIPHDLPHSIHATTCKYYYTVDVLIKTKTKEQQVHKRTFLVTTPNNTTTLPNDHTIGTNGYTSRYTNAGTGHTNNNNGRTVGSHYHHHSTVITTGRVRMGTCLGMAHSNGLPKHLSSTIIHRPKGTMTVLQHQYHQPVQSPQYGWSTDQRQDVQTVRVSNNDGRPVCVMTVIGTQTLTPGSRIVLQWDFPTNTTTTTTTTDNNSRQPNTHQHHHHHYNNWVPCYQVCACLMGEEYAIYEDGTKRRTQTLLFDTCQQYVEPYGGTNRITHTLWLSSSSSTNTTTTAGSSSISSSTTGVDNGLQQATTGAPCPLCTDMMELNVWCQVDLTVRENESLDEDDTNKLNNERSNNNRYSTLTVKIPCTIRHHLEDQYDDGYYDVGGENRVAPLQELLDTRGRGEKYCQRTSSSSSFPTHDILPDLTTLALAMEEHVRTGYSAIR